MQQVNSDTAILLFTQGAEVSAKKALTGSEHIDRQVFQAIIDHIQSLAQSLNLPLHVWGGSSNCSLEENLLEGLQRMSAAGYQRIIVLGDDTPGIDRLDLQECLAHLDRGSHVLAPSQDGGCWLLGLQLATLQVQELKQLPWKQESLFEHLLQRIQNQGSVKVLATKTDLDSPDRVLAALQEAPTELRRQLIQLLYNPANPGPSKDIHVHTAPSWNEKLLRAPPGC